MTFDEIREVLAQVALQQQETAKGLEETRKIADSNTKGLEETRKIVDSNARAIEANASAIADLRELIAEGRRDTRASIEDLVQMGVETYELVMQNSTDIRRMQVEGRRILRELRDRRRNEG